VAEKKEQPKPEAKEEPKAEVKQEAKEESKDPAPKDEKPTGKQVTRTMYLNQDTVAQKLISKIKLHKGLKVQATKNVDSHTGWIYVDAGRGQHGWVKEYAVSESPAGTITKKGKHKK
jgi:hypothetical protein